ncbi:MAG: DUF2493 domain-containing protein [Erysipelotrichaceae bacterium]|nr:DUF2493 domain-containing protein [Erysipelotrichaceae bacterium]
MKRKIKRFIVAGGVHFEDYETLKETLDDLFKEIPKDEIEIISGHARGADSLGEKYAEEKGLKCIVFPADWKKYGRAAGPIRNRQMLDYALEEEAHLVAFWNGESRGTKNMIDIATKAGISIKIIGY